MVTSKNNITEWNIYWHLFNYACLLALVNNNTYMAKQLSYRKLQSKNIQNLFVQVCYLVILKLMTHKEVHENIVPDNIVPDNIVPVIDRGVFHNYVRMCKQLVLCVM